MVSGFNHDFIYRGEKFHLQAEDCGSKTARIVTHLFKDGSIIASRKTSYADILTVDNLEKVVQELMKDQARDVLRSLRGGEYDPIIYGKDQKGELIREKAVRHLEPEAAPPGGEPPPPPDTGHEEAPALFSVVEDDSDPLEAFGLAKKLAVPWWQAEGGETVEEEEEPAPGGLQLAAPWWDEKSPEEGEQEEKTSPFAGLELAAPWWGIKDAAEKAEAAPNGKAQTPKDNPLLKKKK
ncbi:MAG: hypothetical protein GXY54_04015 [Deltaproteobacteria bacterium]|nr:hypothetical protein [Deltaproteobacteria bacterium]